MIKPLIPLDETERLKDLLSYHILDTEAEQDFDDLSKLAANICNCELATITFIDKERQWFKSTVNVPIRETPRQESFCGHAILEDEVLIVLDAKKDIRFFDNPNVVSGISISFYAGAPIYSETGHALGTICVLDKNKKTELSEYQISALKILANQVSRLLQLRLNNKLLIEQTEKIISTEKALTGMYIRKLDSECKQIATELHENHLQTLAAAKLYVEMAQQAKDLSEPFLKKGIHNISLVMEEIRNLSIKITPTTFDKADYSSLIKELVQTHIDKSDLKITIVSAPLLSNICQQTGLVVFRITEQMLQLSHESGADALVMDVKLDNMLNISFLHNGKYDQQQQQWGYSNLYSRADMINAPIQYNGKNEKGFHVFNMNIPMN